MSEILETEAEHSPATIDCVECAYEGRGLHNPLPYAGTHSRGDGWTNVAYGPCPVCHESTTALWGFDMLAPITRSNVSDEAWYVR
jgi:hypothetical protein